uniref:Uncharacterized protein n=1 Tax=viral metagenome TaxID=1070528 RepID=A0A6C0BTA3_9ZZZZ
MIFRESNGKLTDIKKYDFIDDNKYFEKIIYINKKFNNKFNNKSNQSNDNNSSIITKNITQKPEFVKKKLLSKL